jgi:mono/diheme cytochrome c family protein
MKIKFKVFAQITVVAFFAVACSKDPDSAGLEYMPDMYRSPAIEPYVDYGEIREQEKIELKMQLSALTPPSFTIPYLGTDSTIVHTMLPYWRKAGSVFKQTHGFYTNDLSTNPDSDFEYKASAADFNPIKLVSKEQADKLFEQGKKLYQINCNHCHGEKGDGNGPMVASGAYVGVPDYKNLTIAEGQMFYSIYYGKGMMGAHASLLNKREIWTLVHYIKRFQDANYGAFDANGNKVAATAAPADSTAKN